MLPDDDEVVIFVRAFRMILLDARFLKISKLAETSAGVIAVPSDQSASSRSSQVIFSKLEISQLARSHSKISFSEL